MKPEYVPRSMTVANLFQLLTRNVWTVTQVTGSVPQESVFISFKKSVMSTVQSGTVLYAKDVALVRLLTLMGSVSSWILNADSMMQKQSSVKHVGLGMNLTKTRPPVLSQLFKQF